MLYILKKKEKKIIEKTLHKLIDYAESHFKTEEELFEKYNFSNKEKHIKQHREFVNKVKEYMRKYEKGVPIVSRDLIVFILRWIDNHLISCDQKFSKEICNKNKN